MNKRILVFGSSGHAKSIAVVLELLNYEIVGFIDSFLPKGTKVLSYRIIGNETILSGSMEVYGTNNIVVGIGDMFNRHRIVKKINSINPDLNFPVIISPKSYVADYTSIGKGTVVLSNALINVEDSIGEFCIINSSCIIEHNSVIGNYCNVSSGANIGGNVTIDDNTFIGSSVTIIQKRNIGRNSVIGAGAVVTKNIPDNVLAVGVPAIVKKVNYINNSIFI